MSNMITIKVWLNSGANAFSTYESSFEIDRDEWNAMSEAEQEDYARDVAWARMDWGYSSDR